VFFGGVLLMLSSAGAGALLGWENRDTVVRVHVGHLVWSGHLYAVLVVGALLACWFLLGVAFIHCRIAERRGARTAGAGAADMPVEPGRPPAQRTPQPRSRVPAGRALVQR
jgi:hypothetical protein